MLIKRKIETIQTPPPHQGFLGRGHVARALMQNNFIQTDPFILLMDDQINVPDGEPVGGPHPHAGFETVSLILEGKLGNDEDAVSAGDFQLMTAGSGIIHTESIEPKTKLRVLQLWLTLPKRLRWTTPRMQNMHFENVPKLSSNGVDIRLYSGSFAGISSPIQNYVPLVIADIQVRPDIVTRQTFPASYNTFLYVLDGSIEVGEERKLLTQGQVGWLNKSSEHTESELTLGGGKSGGRFVLYSAEPQHDAIVSYGPFIGDKQQDIVRLYNEYHQGKMKHVSTLKEPQLINY